MRAFDMVDLRTWVRDPEWTTLFNLRSNYNHVRGIVHFDEVDFCCPLEVRENLKYRVSHRL